MDILNFRGKTGTNIRTTFKKKGEKGPNVSLTVSKTMTR